ncbi:MAG TPA: EutN/CcmL family microcompartment protein [bacterium]|nr:EutN/CcmL family microcompartment protein [bacterium]
MKAGMVLGSVVAARVAEGLEGKRFLLALPVDEKDRPVGGEFVACDVVGAGRGARVIWIGGKEAALALGRDEVPVDATCVAILERHGRNKEGA